jgi:hypothetical protein
LAIRTGKECQKQLCADAIRYVYRALIDHSMTYSARASSDGGIVSPSALAVLQGVSIDMALTLARVCPRFRGVSPKYPRVFADYQQRDAYRMLGSIDVG